MNLWQHFSSLDLMLADAAAQYLCPSDHKVPKSHGRGREWGELRKHLTPGRVSRQSRCFLCAAKPGSVCCCFDGGSPSHSSEDSISAQEPHVTCLAPKCGRSPFVPPVLNYLYVKLRSREGYHSDCS